MSLIKNTSGQYLYEVLVNDTDGSAITAGATIALSLDGGASAGGAGALAHVTGGLWKYALTAAETNGNSLGYVFGGTNVVPRGGLIVTQDHPRTAIPPTAAGGLGGLPLVVEAGGGVAMASSQSFNNVGQVAALPANITQVASVNIPTPSVAGVLPVDTTYTGGVLVKFYDGAVAGASASSVTLDAADPWAANDLKDSTVRIASGPGAGQAKPITAYNATTHVANIPGTWTTLPTTASKYQIESCNLASGIANVAFPANLGVMLISGAGALTVGTNQDKTGYALSQSFPSGFANLAITSAGRVDVGNWLGQPVSVDGSSFPNVNARDWGGSLVTGGLPNTTAPPTTAAIVAAIDSTSAKLDATVSSRLASSAYVAPDNTTLTHLSTGLQSDGASGFQFTPTMLANGPAGGGGGGGGIGLSTLQVANLCYVLGLDGVATAPATGVAHLTVGVGDKTGFSLAAAGLDAIAVEAGINARQALAPILAACAGTVAGAGTANVAIKGANNTTTRISAAVDAVGNRTSVTLVLPT